MKTANKFSKAIKNVDLVVNSFGRASGIVCMVAIVFTLSAGVVSRYVFSRPFFWTDELARILLIWSIFLGAALGFRKETPVAHIGMDYFVSIVPNKIKQIINRFEQLVNVLFCIIMISIGVSFFIQTLSFQTAALEISKGYIYASLPVFAIMALVFLINQLMDR